MTVYIVLWTWILLLSVMKETKIKNISYWLFLVAMIFVAGGRSIEIGIDTIRYEEIYSYVLSYGYIEYLEPLWNIVMLFSSMLSTNFNVFLLITSLLTLFPIFYISKKESISPSLSIFIYISMHLFTGSFNATRQYLGFSYILVGFYFYSKDMKFKSAIFLFISFLFHYSNIFAFAIFMQRIFFKKLSKKKVILLLFSSLLIGSSMGTSILSSLPLFKFSSYVESSESLYKTDSLNAFVMVFLMNFFAFLIVMTMRNSLLKNSWFTFFLLSMIILNLTFLLEYGTRLYNLFAISHIIFIPMYLANVNLKHAFVLRIFIYLFYSILFFRMLVVNANGIWPYENVFISV